MGQRRICFSPGLPWLLFMKSEGKQGFRLLSDMSDAPGNRKGVLGFLLGMGEALKPVPL